ncbi:hypothetical protein CBM2634_U220008 [Cupriavidus taiwanensis]|uniref:Uncharacterized protein n=1 Tax=Cupriavidus taiwanensis TaxID=164546 RepID=A0A375JFD3_9BURK|nr:hypothetical protein CBM2634_U220008 [Cupriavidus taiwanensis]
MDRKSASLLWFWCFEHVAKMRALLANSIRARRHGLHDEAAYKSATNPLSSLTLAFT